ncbi:nucleoside hydrolase [Streptoalloteichus hindustanus]|uniref:Purine nucleosidase n=1 Tax=Streptoalloteichus hindustanus TaxID=2017 RepID=A0A1M4UV87_STRHI|nr:nucleoside hydrolase [Streptoalloteichus hindustanus]SHE60604.1 purine nucleosidase [Streptoalloteichus hindustanus]
MTEGNNGGRRRIVLDTDPGIDDSIAFLYLAAQPDAEIVAVGSVHGNVSSRLTAENALRLLDLVDLPHVPVAVGAQRPLAQPLLRGGEAVHGVDGLGGVAGPPSPRQPVPESAAEQLVRLARQHPGELSVLALGPLTNVALAYLLEPELPRLLREVVCMGGAVAVPGNITPHAEANIWHDPEAAEVVLGAGFDLTLVPLDVTLRTWAGAAWWNAVAQVDHPRARFACEVTAHYIDFYKIHPSDEPGCPLHDALAAAVLLDPALVRCEEHRVTVELTGAQTRGATLADRRGFPSPEDPAARPPIRVATEVDAPEVLARIHRALGVAEARIAR